MRNLSNQDGYSLLELLVVISILTMSYMLVTPMIVGNNAGVELNSTAQKIVSDLRTLRSNAVIRGEVSQFRIAEDGRSYIISTRAGTTQIDGDITLYSVAENAYGNNISFYPDGTNSGLHLRLKVGENARDIISIWPSGKVEVRDAV